MNVFYEEDGGFKAASVMSDTGGSLQVEALTGKRSKVKSANVLLRFEQPLAGFMEAAQQEAEALERYGRYVARNTTENVVLAMAKRTAEAEAVARRCDGHSAREAALEAERDALKARVAELEAKAAPPPVVVTREMVEALCLGLRRLFEVEWMQTDDGVMLQAMKACEQALEVKP